MVFVAKLAYHEIVRTPSTASSQIVVEDHLAGATTQDVPPANLEVTSVATLA